MIFVTVGTQLPFDRMVQSIDRWVGKNRCCDVFAQIGQTKYKPNNILYSNFIDAQQFRRRVYEADCVVAHAGMGSILTALEMGKPIVVMPRRADLNEHRNDHQLATAKQFLAQGRIVVAFDESHLWEKLEEIATFRPGQRISSQASPRLIATLREFINGGERHAQSAATVGIGIANNRGSYDIALPSGVSVNAPLAHVTSLDR